MSSELISIDNLRSLYLYSNGSYRNLKFFYVPVDYAAQYITHLITIDDNEGIILWF